MNEIEKYLEWLHKEGLINIVQHCAATDLANESCIARNFGKVGHNQRTEFDR